MLEIDFLIPASHSLKEKRSVVRSLKDKIRQGFNISIAEVAYQDLAGRCHLALVTVSTVRGDAEKRLNKAAELIETCPEIQVVDRVLQWL